MRILTINPGGGSTKISLFDNRRRILAETITHPAHQLARFRHVLDQYAMRRDAILSVLHQHGIALQSIGAIATRGGPLLPLPPGVFRVTPLVVKDIQRGRYQTVHPSLLGPLIAYELSTSFGIPAWFVDPESADQMIPEARLTGLKGVQRRALSHALSCHAAARTAARLLKKDYQHCRLVVVHLGTGITVAAHVKGRQIDATNANDEGAFSPQRSGTLPISALVHLCFSGRYAETEVLDICQRQAGLLSLLHTEDIRQVEARIADGDTDARLAFNAMVYAIAKEIGAYAVACGGRPDAIVITGGLTFSKLLIRTLRRWLLPHFPRVIVLKGEVESVAMATRVIDVMNGTEKEKDYAKETSVRR